MLFISDCNREFIGSGFLPFFCLLKRANSMKQNFYQRGRSCVYMLTASREFRTAHVHIGMENKCCHSIPCWAELCRVATVQWNRAFCKVVKRRSSSVAILGFSADPKPAEVLLLLLPSPLISHISALLPHLLPFSGFTLETMEVSLVPCPN